jgi:hypothetical protein
MFAAIEGTALFNKSPHDTLSEHLRWWFAFEGKPAGWIVRRAALIAGLIWLFAHLVFDV